MREIRRKVQTLSKQEIIEILKMNTSGVLSLLSDEGYPYGVPLSYVYEESKIIFHCAKVGHKIDAIKHHDKVCFTVIAQDDVISKQNTTWYKSVIIFGKIHMVEDVDEVKKYLQMISGKYSSLPKEENEIKINAEYARVCILVLEIEHMSGKQAKGLMKNGVKC